MFLTIIVSIICIVVLLFFILKNPKKSLLGYFSIFSILLSLLSIYFIEKGLYISELGINSYQSNGTIRLSIYFITFIIVFFSTFKLDDTAQIRQPRGLINTYVYKYSLIFTYVLLAYLFLDLAISGCPLFNSSLPSKFNYYLKISRLPLTSKFMTLITYYIPIILGSLYDIKKDEKKYKIKCNLTIIIMCIYMFCVGYKISGIRQIIIGYLIPIVYRNIIQKKVTINIKFVKRIVTIIIFFLLALFINYSIFSNGMNAIDKMKTRIFALTSHLWWAADITRNSHSLSIDEMINNGSEIFISIVNRSKIENVGVSKLMKLYGEKNITNYYFENNVKMGATFITTTLYDFGYIITFFVVIFFAIVYSLIIKSFSKSILNSNVLEIMILYKILVYLETFMWGTGTISDFINLENLILIVIFITYKMLVKKRRSNYEKNIQQDYSFVL